MKAFACALRPSPSAAAPRPACRPPPANRRRRGRCALKKVLAMPPPISSVSATSMSMVEHGDLVRDLGAAEDRHERPLGMLQRAAEEVQLLLHQEAGHGGQVVRDALGAGVRAVRRAEGVVDVDVAQRGKLARESRDRSPPPRDGSAGSPAAAPGPAGAPAPSPRPPARRSPAPARPGCPSSSLSRSATGCRLYFGSDLALGPAQVAHQHRLRRRGRAGTGSSAARRGCACRR